MIANTHVLYTQLVLEQCTIIVSVSALSLLPADSSLTLPNVTTVVAPVRNWKSLGGWLEVPSVKRDEIGSKYSTDVQKKEALMDYWLRCCPIVSWSELAGGLHYREEKKPLQLIQRHLKKTTGMLMVIIIMHISPQ